jgi:AraC-like DNA-binding protein
MTDAILLSIPKERFGKLVSASPALSAALFAHYETDLWRMSHQLKNTAGYLSVERKLAIKLLKLSQDFGVPCGEGTAISFPLTVTQTAEFVGLPRETTSRACKKLTEMGLIRRLSVGKRSAVYEYIRDQHMHLVCSRCGGVIDVQADMTGMIREAARCCGHQVEFAEVNAHGICKACCDLEQNKAAQ